MEGISTWSCALFSNYRSLKNKHGAQIEEFRTGLMTQVTPNYKKCKKDLQTYCFTKIHVGDNTQTFWLSNGDTNSKVFHVSVSARRLNNTKKGV